MKLRQLTVALAAAALLVAQADTTLQRAIRKETIEGDLRGAVELYLKAISQSGKDRATAAQALLRLGDCYAKQGDKQARQTYERLIREFGDSAEASKARAKLAALGGAPGLGEITTSLVGQDDVFFAVTAIEKALVAGTNKGTGDLMLRDLLTGESRNLTNNALDRKGKDFAGNAIISGDGKMAAYSWATNFEDKQEIRSIKTDGTGMRIHFSNKRTPWVNPVALSPDKNTLLVATQATEPGIPGTKIILQSLALTDNSLKAFAEGFRGQNASFSPDGKLVALSGSIGPRGATGSDLFLANADGGGLHPLLVEQGEDMEPRWTADGKWIVFISNRTGPRALWAIPSGGGEPRLLKLVPDIYTLQGLTQDGSLFYTTATSLREIQAVKLDPATLTVAGAPGRLIDTFLGRNDFLHFSPDGKWIAWRSLRQEGFAAVVRPTAGGDEKVLSTGGGNPNMGEGLPRWFPDSQSLMIRRVLAGQDILYRIEVADGGVTEMYRGTLGNGMPEVIAAGDGNVLLWVRCGSGGANCGLVRYDLQKKSETVEALGEILGGSKLVASPDGKWLAMRGRLPSQDAFSIFVRPAAPGGELVELVRSVTGLNESFVFTPDSKQVLYSVVDTTPPFHEFRVVPVGGGTPKSIPLAGQSPNLHPDWRFAYTQNSTRFEAWVVRNLPLK